MKPSEKWSYSSSFDKKVSRWMNNCELHERNLWNDCTYKRFPCCIAWFKHKRGWENSRQLCKPETKSRVCITIKSSPNPSSVYIRLCKDRKTVFCCFYKITSSKNYNARKDKKKFILLIKAYLPTTLLWQWHFLTDQSKLPFQKSGDGVFVFVYLYDTQPCTLMQPRLSANQMARTILVIL